MQLYLQLYLQLYYIFTIIWFTLKEGVNIKSHIFNFPHVHLHYNHDNPLHKYHLMYKLLYKLKTSRTSKPTPSNPHIFNLPHFKTHTFNFPHLQFPISSISHTFNFPHLQFPTRLISHIFKTHIFISTIILYISIILCISFYISSKLTALQNPHLQIPISSTSRTSKPTRLISYTFNFPYLQSPTLQNPHINFTHV